MTAALSPSSCPAPVPVVTLREGPPRFVEYLRRVPNPRRAQGRRHLLAAILLLVVVGTLAGRKYWLGIAECGRGAQADVQQALGFWAGKTPAPSRLREVLRAVDWTAFATQLRTWSLALMAHLDPSQQQAFSCDGKSVRASLREGAEFAHLLSVFVHELGLTLDLDPVSTKSNEIPATPKLLLRLPLRGRVIVVDALLTQEEIPETVVRAGGDYLLPVKGNQPGLMQELQPVFSRPCLPRWRLESTEANDEGHGRRELRRLTVAAPPAKARLKWGWVRQYFLWERVRWLGKAAAPERTLV